LLFDGLRARELELEDVDGVLKRSRGPLECREIPSGDLCGSQPAIELFALAERPFESLEEPAGVALAVSQLAQLVGRER